MSAAADSRFVYVPKKRQPIEVQPSVEKPGLVWVRSTNPKTPDRWYQVRDANTPHAQCNCQAASNGIECSHVVAAMEVAQNMSQQTESPPKDTEPISISRAIEPHNPQPDKSLALRRTMDLGQRAVALRERAMAVVAAAEAYLIIGEMWVEARLVPDYIKNPKQAALVLMRAAELQIPEGQAFDYFAIIGNKIMLQGQLVQALVQRSGVGKIEVLDASDVKVVACGTRPGYRPLTVTVTLEQARTMGVKNLDKFPQDMMVWKAIARVGRRLFSDVLAGMDVTDGEGVIDSIAEEGDYEVDVPADSWGSDSLPSNEAAEPEPLEGEYRQSERPADPVPSYPWGNEMDAAVEASPIEYPQISRFLGVPDGASDAEFAQAIESWLNPDVGMPRTPADLVKATADAAARML